MIFGLAKVSADPSLCSGRHAGLGGLGWLCFKRSMSNPSITGILLFFAFRVRFKDGKTELFRGDVTVMR
jgi:hypothetical protein